jgi:hypothetical protein
MFAGLCLAVEALVLPMLDLNCASLAQPNQQSLPQKHAAAVQHTTHRAKHW